MPIEGDPAMRGVKVWLPEAIASELAAEAVRRSPSMPSKSAVVADALARYFEEGRPSSSGAVRRRARELSRV